MGEKGKLEYSVVMEKSDQYEHNKSVRLPQRPMPPIQDQHVQSQPDYSPDRIENPFVIPGIRKTKIDSNLNGTYVFERYIEGIATALHALLLWPFLIIQALIHLTRFYLRAYRSWKNTLGTEYWQPN